MAIAGDRPERGVRIAIERDARATDPPWRYAGAAHLPDATFAIALTVAANGDVDVRIEDERAPEDLAERVRLIVRAVYRQAAADDEAPAWRIVRWRGEK